MSTLSNKIDTHRAAVGRGMAWLVAVFIGIQAIRAGMNPAGFADYFGLPLASNGDGFVRVYAVRAVFLGACAGALLLQRETRALSTFAFAATLMPAGDFALVLHAGGPTPTLVRHAAIAAVLLLTGYLLRATSTALSCDPSA